MPVLKAEDVAGYFATTVNDKDAAELRGGWRAISCKSSKGSFSNMEEL